MVQCVKLHPAYEVLLAAEKCWSGNDAEAQSRADLVFSLLVKGAHLKVKNLVAGKYVPATPRHAKGA